ncbi:SpoIID/LytB domain-containing protein [[Clostridium] colinum]|uniref:SpoIID/LytB domain-containing protein n=1 Tax=[Clostridium] colinum TaxID=36835 RepID=UPI002023FAB0|nr:SpoIID/LytB domain-containing protein [[Clostridium] colinum]
MKNISFVVINILFFIGYFNFNIYASQQYISVGLSKYQNTSAISLDNKNIVLGKNNNSIFQEDIGLSTNSNYVIKGLSTYSIKYNNVFYNYNEALNFSTSYKDSYIYKDDKWYVMIGNFSNILDADNFIRSQNISGEIVKIENSIGIYDNNKLILGYKDIVSIKSNNNISISNKEYRNFINIICKNNTLNVTNILDIEEYLYGVVPSEMPSSWPKEALKAQSVACRNYAYSNIGVHKNEGYDVCDTVHCQVYNGVSGEKQSTNEAVNETKGIFAYYNNEKINAVYSSSSGGYTDDSENVWNTSVPYLKAVKDEYEEGAKQWTRTFTFDELSSVASVGTVNEVILESSPVTGRAISLTFVGTNGKKVLEKEEIRTFFSKFKGGSLESRNFKMAQSSNYSNTNITSNNSINKYYGISSKGNNVIDKDNYFTINKDNNTVKSSEMFVIDKSGNKTNILSTNNKPTNTTTNFASKISKTDSNSITFVGKGWGHGVGMSQYGANSLAKKGYKFDEILKYYYIGIEVR